MPSVPSPRLAAGGIVAAAGMVAAISIVSRVVGLGRWVVFSNSVGATCLGQVYATANQVPNVLYEAAAGGALAAVAVPLISTYLNRGDERRADQTASALLTWALLALLPISVIVILLANPLAVLFTGNSTTCSPEASHRVAALMLVAFAPQIALYGVGVVLTGVLQAHRRFAAAALAPLLSSLVVIGTYVIYGVMYDPKVPLDRAPDSGILLLALGTTAGVVALSVPLVLPTLAAGVRLRPALRFPEGTAARAGALAVAGLVAVIGQQAVVIVALLLSNRVGVGTINVYTYTQTAYLLPYALLVVPLATVAFPRLSDPIDGPVTLRRTMSGVVVAAVAAVAALMAVRREIGAIFVSLDAGGSGAGREALLAMPDAIAAYAPGLLGFSVTALLTRALYAVGSPLRASAAISVGWAVAGLVPIVVFVVADVDSPTQVLVLMGVSNSIGMTLTALMLTRAVRTSWGFAATAGGGRAFGAALGAGVVVVGVREALAATSVLPGVEQGAWSAMLVVTLTGVIVLATIAAAVGSLEPDLVSSLLTRLRRRSNAKDGAS